MKEKITESKPNPVLKKFVKSFPKGEALDLGAGQGRNSLFLAEKGFKVEAVDKDYKALEKCNNFAKRKKLKIKIVKSDIRKFDFKKNKYSLVISIAALDFLKKTEIENIIKKIRKSLTKNGIIFLFVFSIKDPIYKKIKEIKLKEIEENTFYLPKYKTYRHFFTKKEIIKILQEFKIIHLKQKKIKDTGHGQPHFHNVIEIIAKK